jgi:NAD(P)-dependent dehydrogenase (short-subunit alcohol dehydrogenase family)
MTDPVRDHAVVIGGTKGLGKIVVERFLSRGFNVTAVSRGKPSFADGNPAFVHVVSDLETMTLADGTVAQIVGVHGAIRYVVFCQRYRGTGDPWRGEIQVVLTATKLLIDALAGHFCRDGDRAIGVVSSGYADFVGGTQPSAYHVAKAGLNQLVRHYAVTLGEIGIRANVVVPLTYLKPENADFFRSEPELVALYQKIVPLKRFGKAEDSADLLDFLCSDKASFINGQSIYVDGGISLLWPENVARGIAGF